MFEWGKDKTVFNLDNKNNVPATWDYYIKQLKVGGEWFVLQNHYRRFVWYTTHRIKDVFDNTKITKGLGQYEFK